MLYLILRIERDVLEDVNNSSSKEIFKRFLSGVFLIILALYLNFHGGFLFFAAIFIASVILIREFYKLFNINIFHLYFYFNVFICFSILICTFLNLYYFSVTFFLSGIIFSLYVFKGRLLLSAVPYFYLFAPLALLINLNSYNEGKLIIYWIYLVVWTVDISGYVFGNLFKGRKLIPSISPNKTWSGFIMGVILSGFVSVIYAKLISLNNLLFFFIFGLIGGLVSVAGDLFESKLKRINNKKDVSSLIPGHGGLLDRLDGFLFVILYYWLLSFFRSIF